jgi:putative ABC transport system permease protein
VSVLDRKLSRELVHSGLMLLAITGIIAIGVGCYMAMSSCHRNLSIGLQQYYTQCQMADFSIELKRAPLADVAAVARLPGVLEIRPRIQSFTTVDLEDSDELINGLVLSLPDRRQPVINDIVLRQGGYFTDRRDNEVIVNEAFARHHKLYPGQWIHVLVNNRRQELFIVGTAISSEFVYLLGPGAIIPDAARFGVFYIKQSFAEEVFDFQGACNQVLGRLGPVERAFPDPVLQRAERLLDDFGVFSTTPQRDQASNRFISNEIEQLGSFGMVMPAIFLAVAALVLNMLMSRLTEHQRVVVGTLKALGYHDVQVFSHFMKFGLAVGLVGGALGCALGYWLAGMMTDLYRLFFQFPSLVNRVYPETWFASVMISVLCALVGSLHGARAVMRLEPAEAMRPKPPPQGGAIGCGPAPGCLRRPWERR